MQYRVADYVLDLRKFEVRKDGRLLPAEPQVLSLLFLLIESRDRLVTKDELVAAIWNGRAVSDSAISSRIKSARQLLGDDGEAQRLIRTIHGKGFRFVGEVSICEASDVVTPRTSLTRTDMWIAGQEAGSSASEAGPMERIQRVNPTGGKPLMGWPLLLGIAAAVLLLIGLLFWRPWSAGATLSVAVTPASESPVSDALARDLTAKLAMLSSVGPSPTRLLDRAGRENPKWKFEIDAAAEGTEIDGNLVLLSEKGELLWSKDFRERPEKLSDLKQQLAFTAAKVLECAVETTDRTARLQRQIVKLYLNACAAYADVNESNLREIGAIFRRVVDAAPAFLPAWRKLLLTHAATVDYYDRSEVDIPRAHQILVAARKINPAMPETYVVQAGLAPPSAMTDRMRLIELAARGAPESADIAYIYTLYLLRVGRSNDAVDESMRAIQIDPLSPADRELAILALGSAGRIAEAEEQLRQADALWPGALTLREARYTLHLRFADPKEAIRLRHSGLHMPSSSPFQGSFLAARANPTPANVESALRDARALYHRNPIAIAHFSQTLAAFHREDELFPILLNWQYPDKVDQVSDVLFRPAFRDFNHDPRFIRVAARLGLLQYWRSSGKWPDFCFDPDLPYDCKRAAEAAEQARISAEPVWGVRLPASKP